MTALYWPALYRPAQSFMCCRQHGKVWFACGQHEIQYTE